MSQAASPALDGLGMLPNFVKALIGAFTALASVYWGVAKR